MIALYKNCFKKSNDYNDYRFKYLNLVEREVSQCMRNPYKIELGIDLNQSDLGKVKTQLNNFQNQKKINLEINRKNIDNQLNSIRKQIQNLSNIKIDLGKN